MSWRLFKNTIIQPGKEYSLQTIPTLSTAMDFDVRKNQPNFSKMLEKRMQQAYISTDTQDAYKEAYGYTDYDIEQIDPDVLSDEIMDIICSTLSPQEFKDAVANNAKNDADKQADDGEYEEMFDYMFGNQSNKNNTKFTVEQDIYNEFDHIEANKEQIAATAAVEEQQKTASVMRYAGKTISRDMLVSHMGINHGLDDAIVRVYKDIRAKMEQDDEYFSVVNGHLYSRDGSEMYIKNISVSKEELDELNELATDESARVFAEGDIDKSDAEKMSSFVITDAFLKFLVSFPKAWPFADGEFESRMKREMTGDASVLR
jgi:hypothetical protein